MKAVFRVDSSSKIGFGHVIRCLTLADALQARGVATTFICRDHDGNITEKITKKNHQLILLKKEKIEEKRFDKVSEADKWLGAPWNIDLAQTKAHLKKITPDWLIVDHYSIDEKWQSEVIQQCDNLLVIDDLANRNHICNMILDQNYYLDMHKRYNDRVPEDCVQLLGPKYALLQPEFLKLRKETKIRKLPIKKVMIFFGGSDNFNLTDIAINALEEFLEELESIDIVLPSHNQNYESIKRRADLHEKINLYSDLPSLAPLMQKADLAIGAGGTTNWERFCLGLPSLVILIADNQKNTCVDLHNEKKIRLLGDARNFDEDKLIKGLKAILSYKDYNQWSKTIMSLCPGNGAELVANKILS